MTLPGKKDITIDDVRDFARNTLHINPDDIFVEAIEGHRIYLLRSPEEIAKEITASLISIGLSNVNRYSGQLPKSYSVAEHSVYVAYLAHLNNEPIDVIKHCLLHDISESILGDIPSPLKQLIPTYYVIEDNMMEAMLIALGVSYEDHKKYKDIVKYYDLLALGLELRLLGMSNYPESIQSISESLYQDVERLATDMDESGPLFAGPFCVSSHVARGAFRTLLTNLLLDINLFRVKPKLNCPADLVKLQL